MMYKIYSEGVIEVITGPMFSGKSEELIKRVRILQYAKIKTLVIKPAIDTRWDKDKIITRAGMEIKSISIDDVKKIIPIVEKEQFSAICIDEIQFFDKEILDIIIHLANKGKRIIVSGLDQDFNGEPFGVMPYILSIADFVDKQQAVCVVCGKAATMTFKKKKSNNDNQVEIGDDEIYEARCRQCHLKP